MYSPYIAMGNHPESSIDPNGMMPGMNHQNYGNTTHPMRANTDGGGTVGGFASAGWMSGLNGASGDAVFGDTYGDGQSFND